MAPHRILESVVRRPDWLVNGLIAITVMAFAGTASAITTYEIVNGNILAIGNLPLDFDNDELDGDYNITFVTDTGVAQYGEPNIPPPPPTFDFSLSENGVTAMFQITDALNVAPDPVTGASATGSEIFFMPLIQIPIPFVGTAWAALGAEPLAGIWGDCKDDCLVGVRPLGPDDTNTFARVALVPEPGMAALLGLGLAGLGVAGRSRREENQGSTSS